MAGFDNEVLYAVNVDFTSGDPVSGQMTANGQLLIGAAAAPYIRVGTLTQPSAGLTITGGAGSITFALADDLAALEALSGSGIASRTGSSTWGTSSVTQYNVLVGGASQAVSNVAPSATSGVPLISQGASSNPTFGTVAVAGGGTGATTLTGILTGNGTSAVSASTVTQYAVLVGGASNAVSEVGPLTNGQLIIGSTSNAPSAATLTAGTGISITNAAGSITINGIGGGVTWEVVTDASKSAVVNYGYITNRSGGVTVTLPDTAAVGSILRIAGMDGNWVIAQNAGETIYFGLQNTTTGTGGSLTATDNRDCVELVCTVANTDWVVISSVGNITVT